MQWISDLPHVNRFCFLSTVNIASLVALANCNESSLSHGALISSEANLPQSIIYSVAGLLSEMEPQLRASLDLTSWKS